MDINAFNAIKTYGATQRALGPEKAADKTSGNEAGPSDFKPMDAVKDLANTVVKSEQAAQAFMTGNADPHSVVEAIASAELAVETAVTLRNKVVEAYQELLRMPI